MFRILKGEHSLYFSRSDSPIINSKRVHVLLLWNSLVLVFFLLERQCCWLSCGWRRSVSSSPVAETAHWCYRTRTDPASMASSRCKRIGSSYNLLMSRSVNTSQWCLNCCKESLYIDWKRQNSELKHRNWPSASNEIRKDFQTRDITKYNWRAPVLRFTFYFSLSQVQICHHCIYE
jgi:hypothetical protein